MAITGGRTPASPRPARSRRSTRISNDAKSQTTTLEDADGEAPYARRAEGRRPQRMPALSRGQAAAPGVSQLRLLPRPAGARGRRRISRSAGPPDGLSSLGMIRIAVDAMGGDHAPGPIVDGALAAV